MAILSEIAPAKLNLALHVRGQRPDGRHDLETIFAFCLEGDMLEASESEGLSLEFGGAFAAGLEGGSNNLVWRAVVALAEAADVPARASIRLIKNLPVASGIGGGSADAAAALRLLTRLWGTDPSFAAQVAPALGSDVPACLLSMTSRAIGAGDQLTLENAGVSGVPALLINPGQQLLTAEVFARWEGGDGGPLTDWRLGRNDLEMPARLLVPDIGDVLHWLADREGASTARMSGSGATCFALFENEGARDKAATIVPANWWHLATVLR